MAAAEDWEESTVGLMPCDVHAVQEETTGGFQEMVAPLWVQIPSSRVVVGDQGTEPARQEGSLVASVPEQHGREHSPPDQLVPDDPPPSTSSRAVPSTPNQSRSLPASLEIRIPINQRSLSVDQLQANARAVPSISNQSTSTLQGDRSLANPTLGSAYNEWAVSDDSHSLPTSRSSTRVQDCDEPMETENMVVPSPSHRLPASSSLESYYDPPAERGAMEAKDVDGHPQPPPPLDEELMREDDSDSEDCSTLRSVPF